MGEGPNDKGLSRKHVYEQCNGQPQASQNRLYGSLSVPSLRSRSAARRARFDDGHFDQTGQNPLLGRQRMERLANRRGLQTGRRDAPLSHRSSNQPCYNMLTRNIEATVLPTCEKLGVGQVVFSPLAQGVLTGKYVPEKPLPSDSRAADSRHNVFMMGRSFDGQRNSGEGPKAFDYACQRS